MKKILFITAMITLMVFSMSAMACITGGGGGCGGGCGGGDDCSMCDGATVVPASLAGLDGKYYYMWKINLPGQTITHAGLSFDNINDSRIEFDVLHIDLFNGAAATNGAISSLGMSLDSSGFYKGFDNDVHTDAFNGSGGQFIADYTDFGGPSQYSVTTQYTSYVNKWVPGVSGHWQGRGRNRHWVPGVPGHWVQVPITRTRTESKNDPEDKCYDLTDWLKGASPSVIGIGLDPDCHYDVSKIKFWYCTTPTVPAPGAILLGGIGVSIVGWLRRRRTL